MKVCLSLRVFLLHNEPKIQERIQLKCFIWKFQSPNVRPKIIQLCHLGGIRTGDKSSHTSYLKNHGGLQHSQFLVVKNRPLNLPTKKEKWFNLHMLGTNLINPFAVFKAHESQAPKDECKPSGQYLPESKKANMLFFNSKAERRYMFMSAGPGHFLSPRKTARTAYSVLEIGWEPTWSNDKFYPYVPVLKTTKLEIAKWISNKIRPVCCKQHPSKCISHG